MITLNGAPFDAAGQRVAELVQSLGVGPAGVAVALNGEIVPRSAWASTMVPEGSRVEIVTAMAGG